MSIQSQPTLRDLYDLSRHLQLDSDASPSSLRHRDREIGRDLSALQARPVAQLLGWLQRIREDSSGLSGDRANSLHRLGLLVLSVAGLLTGWGTAAVVFLYDGTHPVNVIHVVVVFVFVQLLLLLLFALSLLPGAVTRWLPGVRALQEFFGLLSPGRLQRLLKRYLPQDYRDTADALLGKGIAHQKLFGSVDRWITVHSSQTFAVFFNLGALASALYLVAFSDLAFSWSTTLQVEATELRRWTDLLSAPWAGLFADARPSSQLIESTRYFRLQEGSFPSAVSPVGLGGWWPFLILCMAVYGLLPRAITWFVARQRLGTALRRSFLNLPGTGDVLARLNSELVETGAEGHESSVLELEGGTRGAETAIDLAGQSVVVIDWSDSVIDEERSRNWLSEGAGLTATSWHAAGGVLAPEQDQATIAAVAERSRANNVLVLVKAWEPPMAELLDFLGELRATITRDRLILVTPVGQSASGSAHIADPDDLDVWRRTIGRAGDPWLRVLQLGAPE
jgi:hypothetical protein